MDEKEKEWDKTACMRCRMIFDSETASDKHYEADGQEECRRRSAEAKAARVAAAEEQARVGEEEKRHRDDWDNLLNGCELLAEHIEKIVEQITKGPTPTTLACFRPEDIRVALQQFKTTIHTLIDGYENKASEINRNRFAKVKATFDAAIAELGGSSGGGGKFHIKRRRRKSSKRRRKSSKRKRQSKTKTRRRRR